MRNGVALWIQAREKRVVGYASPMVARRPHFFMNMQDPALLPLIRRLTLASGAFTGGLFGSLGSTFYAVHISIFVLFIRLTGACYAMLYGVSQRSLVSAMPETLCLEFNQHIMSVPMLHVEYSHTSMNG